MARDGQGLEVSNADAERDRALDFLRDEWLAFGNRLAEFVAAADKEERCALLPVMAANLLLSMNSPAATRTATRLSRPRPETRHRRQPARARLARRDRGLVQPARPTARRRSTRTWRPNGRATCCRPSWASSMPSTAATPKGILRIGERILSGQPRQPLRLRDACLRPGGVQSHRRGRGHRAPGARHGSPRSLGAPRRRPLPGGARPDAGGRGLPAKRCPTPGRAATPSCTPTIGGTWRCS